MNGKGIIQWLSENVYQRNVGNKIFFLLGKALYMYIDPCSTTEICYGLVGKHFFKRGWVKC